MSTEGGSIAGLIIIIISTSDLPSDESGMDADDCALGRWSLTCKFSRVCSPSFGTVGLCCFLDFLKHGCSLF